MSAAERKVDFVDPIDQFRDALTGRGIVPGQIIADGQLHRCDVAGRGGRRDGAYLLHLDGFPAGGFQNFRDGLGWQTWKAEIGRSPTREETKALRARAEAERAQREQELARRQIEAAEKAALICTESSACPIDHPYLIRKGVKPYGVLISRNALVVPLSKDGQLRSVQFISADGSKRYLAGGEVHGCSYTIEGTPERVIIAEGFATAATLHEATGFTVKVAFDCGNLAPVARAVRCEFPDAQIVVAADDDYRTVGNPGLMKATDAAAAIGGCIALPDFGEARPEGATDFNDLARHAGIEAVRSCIELALEVGPASTDAGEFGERAHVSFGPYRSGPAGLSYVDPDPERDPVALSGPIEVLAETRDAAGASWGVLVRWRDHDDRPHEWALPRASLAGDGADARRALMDGGLYVAPGRKAREHLTAYLASVRVGERARAVSRMGWHPTEKGLAYVLPDATYGAVNGERVLLQSTSTLAHAFRTAGTLAEWQQHVAAVCVGNSRLVMALSCAFAATLLEPMSEESGGINLRGRSRSGKSTALRVAGSVCGGGGVTGFVRQWRATANGLEATAEGHCDALLVLDEMGQVEAREVGEISYMLSNGSGKGRAARDGSGRRPAQWRILFLSSGELSLAEKMMEAGKRAKAGQEVRLADVPADAGVALGLFEALNGFETADALARHLRDATGRFYGTALRAFLDQFTRRLSVDRDGLIERIAELRRDFITANVGQGAAGQVLSVASRFALVAAGGELATALGVTGWPNGEAERAAATCFKAWLGERGGAQDREIDLGIAQVRAFLEAHGASRFETPWQKDRDGNSVDQRIINRAGFKRQGADERWEYLIPTEAWKNEVCRGHDGRAIAKELIEPAHVVAGQRRQARHHGAHPRGGGHEGVPHHLRNLRR